MTWLAVLDVAGIWTTVLWFSCCTLLSLARSGYRIPRLVHRLWAELKYPVLVYLLFCPLLRVLAYGRPMRPLEMFFVGTNLLLWWAHRNAGDDDDRWKRRRKKLTEKIAQVGSRLTVVPVQP
jgi:hypothetical protein